jgi:glucose/arabinose dehydrogenase
MAFLDDGTMFFTQRHGPISVKLGASAPVQLLAAAPPGLVAGGDAGTLGIAADPNFATNRYIYVCYSHADDNRVVRFTVDANFSRSPHRSRS